jgi:thioredoxin reductase (NADPH)
VTATTPGAPADLQQRAGNTAAFPTLSTAQLETLRAYGGERRVAQGDLLFREGDLSYDFFTLVEGRVAIVERFGRADERFITEHGPGRFLGEMNLLTGQGVYLTAVMLEPGRVIAVPPARLREVIAQDPALSELILRAFLLRRLLLMSRGVGLRVIGSRFSSDTRRLLEFIARNSLPHSWLDLERDPSADVLLREFGVKPSETPVVIWGETVLRNPTNAQVAQTVGLTHTRDATAVADLVVVGGGPAGLAASVYGASEGLSTVTLESVAIGGQAATSTRIENYLGFPAGLSGSELAARAALQAEKFHAHISVPAEVVGLEDQRRVFVLHLADGTEVLARSVIIATGARYRRLGIERFDELQGVGVYYAATQSEAQMCEGSEVAVLGGGNSAGQAAMFLAERTERVHVLIRRPELDQTMSRYLIDQVERHPRVVVHAHTEVRELCGEGQLDGLVVEDNLRGRRETLPVKALFVFIGADPCTDWLEGQLARDAEGFILTGRELPPGSAGGRDPFVFETSRAGIFAVGDVRAASIKRVASAVGEGSMAVRLVHDYLGGAARSVPAAVPALAP